MNFIYSSVLQFASTKLITWVVHNVYNAVHEFLIVLSTINLLVLNQLLGWYLILDDAVYYEF